MQNLFILMYLFTNIFTNLFSFKFANARNFNVATFESTFSLKCFKGFTQLAFTGSNLTTETLEQGVALIWCLYC